VIHEATGWRVSSYTGSQGNCVEVGTWRVSSYSASTGNCVEIGAGVADIADAVIAVRDTQDRGGAVLRVSAETWRRFIAVVR
jgi:hypothetical protein